MNKRILKMAFQDCSTCSHWEWCRGQKQVGAKCYSPTKEKLVKDELMKNERIIKAVSDILDAIIPSICNLSETVLAELPKAIQDAEKHISYEMEVKEDGK